MSGLQDMIAEVLPRLQAVGEAPSGHQPEAGVWSARQVLGHLIDSGVNNHLRFVRAAAESGLELPGYDQNAWVQAGGYQQRPWAELVTLWAAYQTHMAHVIAGLPEAALAHTLSVGGGAPVTLGWLAEDYLQHQRHHLAQIWARAEA
ncbi:DinB family protein [Deinococcus sonorensis]|uniref:DinB family protein n=2 Tax=Deinococcus sonorensis TaxID=309891 RepID=A0AAU7U8S2_9DEIO